MGYVIEENNTLLGVMLLKKLTPCVGVMFLKKTNPLCYVIEETNTLFRGMLLKKLIPCVGVMFFLPFKCQIEHFICIYIGHARLLFTLLQTSLYFIMYSFDETCLYSASSLRFHDVLWLFMIKKI